jgi:hypothetical protein
VSETYQGNSDRFFQGEVIEMEQVQATRGPWAFILAGSTMVVVMVLMSVGMIIGGDPPGWFFPLVFVLFGAVLMAAAGGLFELHRVVRQAAPRTALVGAGLAVPAGLAGLAFVGAGLTGRAPWELAETFYLVAVFGGFTAFLTSSLVLGAAVIATETGPRRVGVLLVVAALMFLVPLSDGLLGWGSPEWTPLVVLGVWVVAFLGGGLVWRGAVGSGGHRGEVAIGGR